MDKRLWINIGLLAFIFLLALILLNTEEETKELPRLSTIDHNDIVQIEILRKDKESYIFSKQGETWHMDSPQHFRANNSRINAMLRILNVESYSQLNPAEIKLENISLVDPEIIMKLNDHEFKFGNTDAIDRRRYILFDGKVHLTNDVLYHQLMTNAAFFADTKLLPENTKINSIKFPQNQIDLVNGQWQMQTSMDISPDQLKRLVFSWQNTAAISVSKYKAPESESIIKISTANNGSMQFVIVSTEPHLILGRKDLDIQYHMGSDEADKLLLKENADTETKTEIPKAK